MTCIILDPGHGGISPGGHYLTKGKQSPEVPPGIYEGEFNRDIALRVSMLLMEMGAESVITAPGAMSPRESDRVKYANALHAVRGDCVYVAIHANAAAGGDWGTAHGATVFVNRKLYWNGWRLSPVGTPIAESILSEFGNHTEINTGRGVQGRRLQVLRATHMPAVLIECAFMTCLSEAVYLASDAGRTDIALAIAIGLHRGF